MPLTGPEIKISVSFKKHSFLKNLNMRHRD